MKISISEIQKLAVETLQSFLSRIPFIGIKEIRGEPDKKGIDGPDFVIELETPDGAKEMVVEVRTSGQPRLAREAVNQLVRNRERFPGAYGVFIGPYISVKAADICRKDNVGYIDLAGNCLLSFDNVYIEQDGRPNPFSEKRDLRSLYSPKAERTLRALLRNPGKSWKIKELAEAVDISLGQASNVKKLLNDREWIQPGPSGFFLSRPGALLSDWADNYEYRKHIVRDFYSLKGVAGIETDLAEYCHREGIQYAFTGFSGAARLAPSVRYRRAMAYIKEIPDALAAFLALKRVESGANIRLFIPYDGGVFHGTEKINGGVVASPAQIYLDLINYRGRGEEAAEIILKEVIQPIW